MRVDSVWGADVQGEVKMSIYANRKRKGRFWGERVSYLTRKWRIRGALWCARAA
jgi:hypothetical protein